VARAHPAFETAPGEHLVGCLIDEHDLAGDQLERVAQNPSIVRLS
jgi:hypothetical protein